MNAAEDVGEHFAALAVLADLDEDVTCTGDADIEEASSLLDAGLEVVAETASTTESVDRGTHAVSDPDVVHVG